MKCPFCDTINDTGYRLHASPRVFVGEQRRVCPNCKHTFSYVARDTFN